jgi:hypothetical protein
MPSTGPQRKGSAVLLLSFPAEEFRSNHRDQTSRPLHGNENPGLHAVRPCQRADAERIRRTVVDDPRAGAEQWGLPITRRDKSGDLRGDIRG